MLELINRFCAEARMSGKAEGTCQNYDMRLRKFSEWCATNGVDYKTITPREIRAYRNYLVSQDFSASMINSCLYTLRLFYDFLTEEEIVAGNPVLVKRLTVPMPEPIPRFLDDQEIQEVIKAIETIKKPTYRLAFMTMYKTGIRLGEAVALRPQDVVVQNDRLFLRLVKSKGRRQRMAPVTDPQVAEALLALKKARKGQPTLFGCSKSTLKYWAKYIARTAGIEDFSSHCLRHTFATELLNREEDPVPLDLVQDTLGHKNIATTRRYAQTLPSRFFRLAAKVG
jgi:site-specific recombinase XerD